MSATYSNSKVQASAKIGEGMAAPTAEASTIRSPGDLYPPIEPYNSGWLTVSDTHELYYEECGNKDGNPIVIL